MMKNKVKELYCGIQPPQTLKEKCLSVKKRNFRGLKAVSAAACALAILAAGGLSVNSYLTPTVTAAPVSFARAETIVNLTVKTHVPVTLTVEEGLLCVDGHEWEKSISLNETCLIGWLIEEDSVSPVMTMQKSGGDTVVYTLTRAENGNWELSE